MIGQDEVREMLIDQLYAQLDEAHQTIVRLSEANEAFRAQLAEHDAAARREGA